MKRTVAVLKYHGVLLYEFFSELPSRLAKTKAVVGYAIAGAAFLARWRNWYTVPGLSETWNDRAPWLITLCWTGWLVMQKNYDRIEVETTRAVSAETSLRELQTARVAILFENRPPYVMDAGGAFMLYRVGVKNITAVAVTSVRVQLHRIEEIPTAQLPIGLHLMHNNALPIQETFDLAPDEEVFVDVVQDARMTGVHQVGPDVVPGHETSFQTIPHSLGMTAPNHRMTAWIRVTGHGMRAVETAFRIFREPAATLRFEPRPPTA